MKKLNKDFYIVARTGLPEDEIQYNSGIYIKYPSYNKALKALNDYPFLVDQFGIYRVHYDNVNGVSSLIRMSK